MCLAISDEDVANVRLAAVGCEDELSMCVGGDAQLLAAVSALVPAVPECDCFS
jgi:hypothetical protein